MAVSPLQEAFNSGELSQRLRGRISSELYKRGLDYDENFRPTPQGSLLMRAGSEKVAELTGDDDTRLVRFRMSDTQDYLLELLDYKLRIYDILTGRMQGLIKSELLTNGDFETPAGAGWTSAFATFAGGGCSLEASLANQGYVYEKVTVAAAGTITLKGTFSAVPTAGVYVRLAMRLGTTAGGAEIFGVIGDIDSRTNPKTLTFTTGVLAPGDYYFFVQASPSPTSLGGTMSVDNLSCYLTVVGSTLDEITTPWTKDEVKDVHFQPDTGKDRMIFTHPKHTPWQLTYVSATDWSFGDIAYTSKPAEWANGSFPATVEIHNGRAWYAIGNHFWASKSGTIDVMTTGANPGDALDFKLTSKGAIKWFQGQRALLCATDIGEHSISGSSNVVLVNDIQVKEESAFGSSKIQGISAGTHALFVTADRTEVRALQYDLQTSGWDSKALSFIGEHIIRNDLVKELHHVRHPEGSVVCLQESGKIAFCAFDPGEQVTAWWRFTLPGAVILSAAVSQGPSGAYLWAAVKRGAKRILEKIRLNDAAGLRYLDSSISAVVDVDGNVSGMGHLAEGTTVKVIVEGALLSGDFAVDGAGKVAVGVDYADKTAEVGIGFTATAITLPLNVKGGKTHHAKLGVILYDSAMPKLNGKRPADRTPSTPQDTPEPRRSGKFDMGNLGWDNEGKITITQDLPFRTEILGLYSRTQAEEA